MNGYQAPWWLPGRHAQTILPSYACRPYVAYQRVRWPTTALDQRVLKPDPPLRPEQLPDDDFIDVDWVGDRAAVDWLVVFHGLEGSSQSHYALHLARRALNENWYMAVPHFRGCSGYANLQLRDYHAGVSDEIDWIVRRFKQKHDERRRDRLFIVGVSLGGNAILKWLGELGDHARLIVNAAVSVSTPFQLSETGARLGRGFSAFYSKLFLPSLESKAMGKLAQPRFKGAFDRRRLEAARILRDFEDACTAPVNGFVDANDYYRRASARPWLAKIRVPTLVLNARNDPFMGEHVLDDVLRSVPNGDGTPLTFEFPEEGGHAGFADGDDWLAKRIFEFLKLH